MVCTAKGRQWRDIIMSITIKQEKLTAKQYVEFLTRTDLGSQYARERFDSRIKKLVKNVSISVVARNSDNVIVGVCFGLTDFCYWLLITDLGVDREYINQGIGRQLMKYAHDVAGGEDDIIVFVSSHQDAYRFYEKIGMKKVNNMLGYDKAQWTDFVVSQCDVDNIDS